MRPYKLRQYDPFIQTQRLGNGVILLLEPVDSVRSVAAGLWIGAGSRHESEARNGISHCLEHMAFKGTEKRAAAEIAAQTDAIGGQFNAYTTKESTAFYARVLDNHLPEALDLLTDMVFHAKLDDSDLDTERGVIFEEIGMYEDTPEDLVGERLLEAVYPGQALGRPILGRADSLASFTGANLRVYRDDYFRAPQMIAALAGKFTDSDARLFADLLAAVPAGKPVAGEPAAYRPAFVTADKPLEQNHLCLALPGLATGDERRYAMQLLCGILGGGASSRLYQKLREEHGLCYAVHGYTVTFADTGLLCVYTALGSETERKALSIICETLAALAHDGPSPGELDRQREQIKANVVLSLESTGARASHAARSMQVLGRVPSPDELIAGYDAVEWAQVRDLAAEVLREPSFSAVGQVKAADEYREIIGQLGVPA